MYKIKWTLFIVNLHQTTIITKSNFVFKFESAIYMHINKILVFITLGKMIPWMIETIFQV